ncbi:MAG TPA: Nif3-like dinuclear metal center hexameric protein [Acidimicrobiia bacterium]|nr:Nif3-like dinuclear metal center hexameric protein [Acidimicrobiia bacterium]
MGSIRSLLDDLALRTRPDRAAAWDPVGLQFGDPEVEVGRVAVCHEVSEGLMERLLDTRPGLVVTYHPLLFRPTNRLVPDRSASGRAFRLITAGIGLAATHTDFDAAPGGTSDSLAEALGLGEVAAFGPIESAAQIKIVTFVPAEVVDTVVESLSAVGAGRIGNYDACSFRVEGTGGFAAGEGADPVVGRAGEMNLEAETRIEMLAPKAREEVVIAALVAAHPYEEPAFDVYDVRSNHGLIGRVGSRDGTLGDLAAVVAEHLGGAGLRVAGDQRSSPGKVAVVPGSGGSFLGAARNAGARAIVTGDIDHHRAVAALDSGVAVIDPGHAATELPGMRSLVEFVAGLAVEVEDLTGDGYGPWSRPA